MRFSGRFLIALVLAALVPSGVGGRERLASVADAYVEHDAEARRWTIGNSVIDLSIVVGARGEVTFGGVGWPAGPRYSVSSAPDSLITLDGDTSPLGSREGPFRVEGVAAGSGGHHVELTVRLHEDRGPLVATRHYMVYPNAAVVEVWTSYESESIDPSSLQDLNAMALTVPAGRITWVNGLDAAADQGGPFSRRAGELSGAGDRLVLGSEINSSSQHVPYVAIQGENATFFTALAWSGTWSAVLERVGDGISVTAGLPRMSAAVSSGAPIEGPHALVGIVPDVSSGAAPALLRAALERRDGRSFPAMSTFNTWFVYGTRIDDRLMRHAVDQSSRVGVELFQLDAGWYPPGDSPASVFDFTSGLGTWAVDERRFPDGLGVIGDHARARGQKFGVWVEPERVDLDTVGREGLAEERFLATNDGAYHPGLPNGEAADAQICLSDRGARQWVLAQLMKFINEARPDCLKWDYNRWVVCNRPGHGHPTDGGNFAHVQGLYEILREIRARYPSLVIENCAGGGRRLDFAMAKLTDTGWMDDKTSPAHHVRHNMQGLATVFPAPYLLSYVMPHDGEPMAGANDMPLLMRSRMPGVLGLAVDFDTLDTLDRELVYQDIVLSSIVKEIQADAATYTLTPQAGEGPDWDVVQQQSISSGRGLVFAFDRGRSESVTVRLRQLNRSTLYQLSSVDRGRLGIVSGAALMDDGLAIRTASESAAQIITLDPADLAPLVGTSRRRR